MISGTGISARSRRASLQRSVELLLHLAVTHGDRRLVGVAAVANDPFAADHHVLDHLSAASEEERVEQAVAAPSDEVDVVRVKDDEIGAHTRRYRAHRTRERLGASGCGFAP